jgi:peptide/nickel transport system ATP-binding protein
MLYQGTMVELGNVDKVIKQPKHPYTQLLVNSIPLPDPKRRWQKKTTQEVLAKPPSGINRGCRFAARCPHVMSKCWESPPPLYGVAHDCAVACYLYSDFPALDKADVMGLYTQS